MKFRHFLFVALVISTDAMAETASYICQFAKEASPSGVIDQSMELRFLVDSKTDKAYIIGNAGSSQVEKIDSANGISFVEITSTGNVMVTAIASDGNAVHSRNGIMFGKLLPSQYYGKCIKQ